VSADGVVIIGEIRLFREGLAQLLNADGRVGVRASVESVSEGVAIVQTLGRCVILMDMATRGSTGGIRALHDANPESKVVALGVADLEADVVTCAEAGADGYVARGANLDELVHSAQCAMRDEVYCSPKAVGQLFHRLTDLAPPVIAPAREHELTRREQQVLELITNGLSNKQIARTLGIELSTVKNHVHRVLEKLNVQRRSQLTAFARGRGAIPRNSARVAIPT
jgi:two-component system, NarL family, nitrate/nitrite response regulator NarL